MARAKAKDSIRLAADARASTQGPGDQGRRPLGNHHSWDVDSIGMFDRYDMNVKAYKMADVDHLFVSLF